MRDDASSLPTCTLMQVRIRAEAETGVLARILGQFQNCGTLPRRVVAEFASNELVHIQIDIAGLSKERMALIVAKLNELTSIFEARWHFL
jgi:hypothetical protein